MHKQLHYDRRHWRTRFGEAQRKNTVRFGQVVHAPRRPLREPSGLELVACLKTTARHYRDLAAKTGRPVTAALFTRFAQERERRAADLEATLRGRQQSNPGELFTGGDTQP